MGNKVLVTGAAGFIGFHLSARLVEDGYEVLGIDNLNDYYSIQLKEDRLSLLREKEGFQFIKMDLEDRAAMERLFASESFHQVIHLAAQAGVRYSVENPHAYVDSNLVGFVNILEGCRHAQVDHLIFASSSSVYGANTPMPFSENQEVGHPISLYAATKRANELMAYTYAHLYQLRVTGLRFFTVYGPWGRPDMSYSLFARAILGEHPIKVFNFGKMERDFTYVGDAVEGVMRVMQQPSAELPADSPPISALPYRIFNIGSNQPISLMRFIETLEDALGHKAIKEFLPMQPGDVSATYADMSKFAAAFGYKPETSLEAGLREFAKWYQSYHKMAV